MVAASIPPSIPVGAGTLQRVLDILCRVETLPPQAVGALCFEPQGVLLVEARSVCFAIAAGMQQRFTQILRYQHTPPLSREFLHDLYRQCKHDQTPLVDALLATGLAPQGLREALFRHTAEAIAHLAAGGVRFSAFVPSIRYRARFLFSTAEVLASLGARGDPALALVAQRHLDALLVPETTGWAFLRDTGKGSPMIIAARGTPAVRGAEMLEICAWAASLFDVTAVFDDSVRVASASWDDGRFVVAWRTPDAYFVAACANRAGAARLVARLDGTLVGGA